MQLLTAISDVIGLKINSGEGEGQRQMRALSAHGYKNQQEFFADFHDAVVADNPVGKKITADHVIALVNMFGKSLLNVFHTNQEKRALFNKVPTSKKSEIKGGLQYTEELDAWGMPIDEVTMAANVAPAELVTPLGMVRSGKQEPVVMKKKKKTS